MKKWTLKKWLVIGLIFQFIWLSIIPAVNSNQKINQTNENINITSQYSNKNVNNEQQKEYHSYKSSDYKNVYVEIKFNGKHVNIPICFSGFYFFIRIKPLGHSHGWGQSNECTTGRLKIYENGELVFNGYYWDLSVDLILFKGDINLFPIFDRDGGEIKGTTLTIHWSGYGF